MYDLELWNLSAELLDRGAGRSVPREPSSPISSQISDSRPSCIIIDNLIISIGRSPLSVSELNDSEVLI
jgi:hypothetical protein